MTEPPNPMSESALRTVCMKGHPTRPPRPGGEGQLPCGCVLAGATREALAAAGVAPDCPDGGTCHHGCTKRCWRVWNAEPLSAAGWGNKWPRDIKALHKPPPDVDAVDSAHEPRCTCTFGPTRNASVIARIGKYAVYLDAFDSDGQFDPACPFHGENGTMVVRMLPRPPWGPRGPGPDVARAAAGMDELPGDQWPLKPSYEISVCRKCGGLVGWEELRKPWTNECPGGVVCRREYGTSRITVRPVGLSEDDRVAEGHPDAPGNKIDHTIAYWKLRPFGSAHLTREQAVRAARAINMLVESGTTEEPLRWICGYNAAGHSVFEVPPDAEVLQPRRDAGGAPDLSGFVCPACPHHEILHDQRGCHAKADVPGTTASGALAGSAWQRCPCVHTPEMIQRETKRDSEPEPPPPTDDKAIDDCANCGHPRHNHAGPYLRRQRPSGCWLCDCADYEQPEHLGAAAPESAAPPPTPQERDDTNAFRAGVVAAAVWLKERSTSATASRAPFWQRVADDLLDEVAGPAASFEPQQKTGARDWVSGESVKLSGLGLGADGTYTIVDSDPLSGEIQLKRKDTR